MIKSIAMMKMDILKLYMRSGLCLLILCAFAFQGCMKVDKKAVTLPVFYDLQSYFDDEVIRNDQNSFSVTKTVSLNGEIESRELTNDELDWNEELSQFRSADINKPALSDKYKEEKQSNPTQIFYHALDKKLQIQSIHIIFSEQDSIPSKVTIQTKTNNFLVRSSKTLLYERGKGFSISGVQKIVLIPENKFEVDAAINDQS